MSIHAVITKWLNDLRTSGRGLPTMLMVPSPYRITQCHEPPHEVTAEWTDHRTAAFYANWLQSGVNLAEYAEHQNAGFPLFTCTEFRTIKNWTPDPGGYLHRKEMEEGALFGTSVRRARQCDVVLGLSPAVGHLPGDGRMTMLIRKPRTV